MPKKKSDKRSRGRPAETLKAEGVDWKDAMSHALKKQKPDEWPEKEDKSADSDGLTDDDDKPMD